MVPSELTKITKPDKYQLNSSRLLLEYNDIIDTRVLKEFIKSKIDDEKLHYLKVIQHERSTIVLFMTQHGKRYRGNIGTLCFREIRSGVFSVKGDNKWRIAKKWIKELSDSSDYSSSDEECDVASISSKSEVDRVGYPSSAEIMKKIEEREIIYHKKLELIEELPYDAWRVRDLLFKMMIKELQSLGRELESAFKQESET